MADFADELASGLIPMDAASAEQEQTQPDNPAPTQETAQPEQQVQQQPQEQRAETEQPQQGHIPIQALLDEREKRQQYERELKELREAQARAQAQQQAPQRPDLYDDPEGFANWSQQQLAAVQWQATETMSKRFASKEYGADTVEAAEKWALAKAQTDPSIGIRFRNSPDPYEVLVSEYKRDQLLNELGSDPDAYVRRRAAELGLGSTQQPGAQPLQPQQGSNPPPRSLATAPGSGGVNATPVGGVFDTLKFARD